MSNFCPFCIFCDVQEVEPANSNRTIVYYYLLMSKGKFALYRKNCFVTLSISEGILQQRLTHVLQSGKQHKVSISVHVTFCHSVF